MNESKTYYIIIIILEWYIQVNYQDTQINNKSKKRIIILFILNINIPLKKFFFYEKII